MSYPTGEQAPIHMSASVTAISSNSNKTNYTQSPLDNAGLIEKWTQQIHDRRGFSIDALNRWCGPRDSGKAIELWLPHELATPDDRRACWGADPYARLDKSIARPVTRAQRFMQGERWGGGVFQVAFECQIGPSLWIPINRWFESLEKELGDRMWADWVDADKREIAGKYMSPAGKDRYCPVWLPDVPTRAIDWEKDGSNKRICKSFHEGPWKLVGQVEGGFTGLPICLAGVDAAIYGKKHDRAGEVRDEVRPLIKQGEILIVFDQDQKPSTIAKVAEAIGRLSRGIRSFRRSAKINVWRWPAAAGKGIDDLICGVGSSWPDLIEVTSVAAAIARGRAIAVTRDPDLKIDLQGIESLARYFDQVAAAIEGKRLVVLVAPTGAGKSELLALLSRMWEHLLLTAPLTRLTAQSAKEFNAIMRSQLKTTRFKDPELGWQTVLEEIPEPRRICTCVEGFESLPPKIFATKDTLFISDEDDQATMQLFDGGTLKNKQRAAYDWRVECGQKCGQVIIASAGISDIDIEFWESVLGEKAFVISATASDPDRFSDIEVMNSSDEDQVVAEILANLDKGLKVLVPCDGRERIDRMKAFVDQARVNEDGSPKHRSIAVHKNNTGDPDVAEFISDKQAYLKRQEQDGNPIDLLFYNSVIGTGWNFVDLDKLFQSFDVVVGHLGGIVSDEGGRQLVTRYRRNVSRKLWIVERSHRRNRFSAEQSESAISSRLIERRKAHASAYGDEYVKRLEALGKFDQNQFGLYEKTWAKVEAKDNRNRSLHREMVIARLELDGHRITRGSRPTDGTITKELAELEGILEDSECLQILKAEKKTAIEIENLKKKDIKTKAENYAIARFYIEDFCCVDFGDLGDDQSLDLIRRYRRSSQRSALLQLGRAMGFYDQHLGLDRDQCDRVIEGNNGIWQLTDNTAKHELLRDLRIRELIEKRKFWAGSEIVSEIYELAKENKSRLKDILAIDYLPASPVAVVNLILRSLDIEIEVKKTGNKKLYKIDQATLDRSLSILNRRFARWQERMAEREAAAADDFDEPIEQVIDPIPVQPIEQPIDPIPNEPIEDPVVETVAAITPIAQPAQPEFWEVSGGAHDGDQVRIDGNEKDGWIRVSPVGKFGSFRVTPDQLKPIVPVTIAPVATAEIEDRRLQAELAIVYAVLNRPRGKGLGKDPNHDEKELKGFEVIEAASAITQENQHPVKALEPLWDWVWDGTVDDLDSLEIDPSIKDWLKEPPFKGYSPIAAIRAAARTLTTP